MALIRFLGLALLESFGNVGIAHGLTCFGECDPDARITQMYYSTSLMSDRNVLIQTDNGQWHICRVDWEPEWQEYDVRSHRYVEDRDNYKNFIPLEGWQTGG